MIIKFSEYGTSLGTRVLGRQIRQQIEECISNNEKVIFDLMDMDILSNSFTDECLAKLLLKFDLDTIKRNTSFINANDNNTRIILKAFRDRISN